MPPNGPTHGDKRPPTLNRWTAASRLIANLGGAGMLIRRAADLYRSGGWAALRRGLAHFAAVSRRESAAGNDYAAWVARYDTITPARRETLVGCAGALRYKPVISIIMPVYNPRPQWLEEAIESVLAQIYGNWELCIADDASTRDGVLEILRRYATLDPRIKVTFRERNGHISAASNTALALAEGEWIALADHDDLLTPHALFWIVDAINRAPHAQIVYSDEDKIDAAGVRGAPHFKPDWNPELFLSYNYVCHLGAYRRELVQHVGGFREGLEGAQDYDLALRCTERVGPGDIVHVPRILYHWRLHQDSTAMGKSSKPYALPAGARALNDHLARVGRDAEAEERSAGAYRIRTRGLSPRPTVSVILTGETSKGCDASMSKQLRDRTDYPFLEILYIEGGLRRASQAAQGEYVLFMDDAMRPLESTWLDEMMACLRQPGVGIVGPRMLDEGGGHIGSALVLGLNGLAGVANAGLPAGDTGYFRRAALTQSVSALGPHCVLIEKSLWDRAAAHMSSDIWNARASVELCLELRKLGYRAVYVADAVMEMPVTAVELSVRAMAGTQISAALETAPHHEDPAYNPNLALDQEGGFTLAWPPRLPPGPEQIADLSAGNPLGELQ